MGRTLQVPFSALYAWTVEHLDDMEQAQRSFDLRKAESAQPVVEVGA